MRKEVNLLEEGSSSALSDRILQKISLHQDGKEVVRIDLAARSAYTVGGDWSAVHTVL